MQPNHGLFEEDYYYEQAAIAERLRKNAYSDVLTGLGNRRYIEGQVTARVVLTTLRFSGRAARIH